MNPPRLLLEPHKRGKSPIGKRRARSKSRSLCRRWGEDEVPYELPEGWVWCRLQQLSEAIDPNPSHRMPNYTEGDGGIPFLSTQNIVGENKWDFSIGKRTSKNLFERAY